MADSGQETVDGQLLATNKGTINSVIFHCKDGSIHASYLKDVYLDWHRIEDMSGYENVDKMVVDSVPMARLAEVVATVGISSVIDILSAFINHSDAIGDVDLTAGSLMYLCKRMDIDLLYKLGDHVVTLNIKTLLSIWNNTKETKINIKTLAFV